jgi:apolipoprotein N-acyltransferase
VNSKNRTSNIEHRTSNVERPGRAALAFGLAALSGFLMFAAFPPLNEGSLGFIALIPFIWALRMHPGAKCRLSYMAGLVFWVPSLWFLSPVTIPGAVMLAAYCALYWLPVGWVWARLLQTWQPDQPVLALRMVLGGAGWWCVIEWVRGWILTGFPWNNLGVTQWENYSLIQIAALGGTTMVSFVLVALNLGIGLSVAGLIENRGRSGPRRMHPELYLPILLLVMSFSWGSRELRRLIQEPTRSLRVGVIQPLSENKWSPELALKNFRVLWELSDAALSLKPELLLWPETAVPEELRYSETASELVKSLVQSGIPLLLGSLDYETTSTETETETELERVYYNSSFLVWTDGTLRSDYRKRHLVMFGEYMPFARYFPFLRSLTPMPEDVTAGTDSGVLMLPVEAAVQLGMLICFEDLMPDLSHDLVREGAELFVNQTNDAWFDPLWGSRGHLANAVFRSIEQRRPMVRGTNSGVSAWIDTRGVVRNRIEDPLTGAVRIRGFKIFDVEVPTDPETTFYFRYPRSFILLCALLSLLIGDWGSKRGDRG